MRIFAANAVGWGPPQVREGEGKGVAGRGRGSKTGAEASCTCKCKKLSLPLSLFLALSPYPARVCLSVCLVCLCVCVYVLMVEEWASSACTQVLPQACDAPVNTIQVFSLDGTEPTSVRMSEEVFHKRNEQGKFQKVPAEVTAAEGIAGPGARHWGEL